MGGRERGVLDIMHGCSRMAMGPSTPTMPGRSVSGCHQPEGGGEGRVEGGRRVFRHVAAVFVKARGAAASGRCPRETNYLS